MMRPCLILLGSNPFFFLLSSVPSPPRLPVSVVRRPVCNQMDISIALFHCNSHWHTVHTAPRLSAFELLKHKTTRAEFFFSRSGNILGDSVVRIQFQMNYSLIVWNNTLSKWESLDTLHFQALFISPYNMRFLLPASSLQQQE
jgi:hypothetical protein